LRADIIHDSPHVIHTLFQSGDASDPVGETCAAFVKEDKPGERGQSFEKASVGGIFPGVL